jgi:hypothetical protein
MNRVLSWPHTAIVPGLLDTLRHDRHSTVVTERGMVRFEMPLGPVEMKFSDAQQQLEAGTEVVVWWKRGGFVCAPTDEVKAEERESRRLAEGVVQARTQIAVARRERQARLASQVDILLPVELEMGQRALL